MKTSQWHLEHAEGLLDAAENMTTMEADAMLTRRAAAHIQLAQALGSVEMIAATVALQQRTSAVLDDTARKLHE